VLVGEEPELFGRRDCTNWLANTSEGQRVRRRPPVSERGSGFGVSLAIRIRSTQSVEHDVQVADKGKHESVMKPDMVSNYPLNYREDCPAYDGHVQDAGPAST